MDKDKIKSDSFREGDRVILKYILPSSPRYDCDNQNGTVIEYEYSEDYPEDSALQVQFDDGDISSYFAWRFELVQSNNHVVYNDKDNEWDNWHKRNSDYDLDAIKRLTGEEPKYSWER